MAAGTDAERKKAALKKETLLGFADGGLNFAIGELCGEHVAALHLGGGADDGDFEWCTGVSGGVSDLVWSVEDADREWHQGCDAVG